jgi:hypothetical protein
MFSQADFIVSCSETYCPVSWKFVPSLLLTCSCVSWAKKQRAVNCPIGQFAGALDSWLRLCGRYPPTYFFPDRLAAQ